MKQDSYAEPPLPVPHYVMMYMNRAEVVPRLTNLESETDHVLNRPLTGRG